MDRSLRLMAVGVVLAAAAAGAMARPDQSPAVASPARGAEWVQDAERALHTRAVRGVVLNLDTRPGQPVAVDLPLGDLVRHVVLTPHSVRGPTFAVMVDSGENKLSQKQAAPVATLRGWIEGVEGSVAAGGMLEEGLFATIITGDGQRWWIEPASRLMGDGTKVPKGAHVIYRGENSTDRSVICTAADAPVAIPSGTSTGIGLRGLTKRVAQVALDLEYRYYSIFGSTARAQAMSEILINIINVQYEREVDITHQISTMIIRTTQLYLPGLPSDYLGQMTTQWRNNHTSVVRDMAIMIQAEGNGGSAWRATLCDNFWAFGHCGIERGGLAFSCNIIGHEMGHIWSACHCPCNNPPFMMDPVANNSNRFAGSAASECGNTSIDEIVAFRNSRPCLTSTSTMHVIPNDDCADAVRLFANPEGTGWADIFGYSNIGANTDGPVSTCRPSSGADIWYRLVAPCTGTMFISTCGSGGANFDTVLTAYAPGAPCPPTQNFQIACSDNDPSCTTPATGSRITFSTTIGQEYLVRVAGSGFPAQTGLGILTIQHTGCPRPANDSCPFATQIQPGVDVPFSTIGATTGARTEGGVNNPHDSWLECMNAGDEQVASDIWYLVRAPCSGQLRISTCGSDFDTKIAVYAGTTCPTADRTAIACNDDFSSCGLDSQVTLNVSNQAQFLIRVGGFFGTEGTGVLRVDALNCAPPFYNICQGAYVLFGNSGGSSNFSMAGALADSVTSCTSTPRPDVWFSYTARCAGTFTFNTCGTVAFGGFPTAVSIHSACPATDANRIGCAGQATCPGSPAFDASASANLAAGQHVYIRVASMTAVAPEWPARFMFNYSLTAPPPPNDSCAGAIPLTNGLAFCTLGSTPSPEGAATCATSPGTGDIWFRYTGACNGNTTIQICPGGFDTHLTVFAGSSCSSPGGAIGCNDDDPSCDGSGSTVTFSTVAGQQYLVRVGSGGEAGDAGHGTIELSCLTIPNFNGACCSGSTCTIRSSGLCTLTGGDFQGIGTDCSPNPCGPSGCRADINQSGTLTVQDIFDFLELYFDGDPLADFNRSRDVSVQDIFDFLAAYFAGCS